MDITVFPKKLSGEVRIIPSKSQAHRLMILAAFSDKPTFLHCPQTNRDIEATAACLNALGAEVQRIPEGYRIRSVTHIPTHATLPCGESGSTLRFLLPVAGALGVEASFLMEGRLPQRPLSPLWEEMERMGCTLSNPENHILHCSGKLNPGEYTIDGSVSSQYITGLLFAMALMDGTSHLCLTGKLESAPYVAMTREAMGCFGISTDQDTVTGCAPFRSPSSVQVEGDWSNGAFWLAANALGSEITVTGLHPASVQGDRAVSDLLARMEGNSSIDASDIPDLVPILAVVAAAKQGASFTGIRRLRLKESDRVASVIALLTALGASAAADENTMTVFPSGFSGGTVDACGDHRIAMAAAIAATVSTAPVTILGADAVNKSYPSFWEEYQRIGGHYELNIR